MAVYRPTRRLARFLIVLLIVFPLLGPLTLPLSIEATDDLVESSNRLVELEVGDDGFGDASEDLLRDAGVLLAVYLPAGLLGGAMLVLLSVWSYRSFRNVAALGRSGLRPGPAVAAVVWWFGAGLGGGFVLDRLWRACGPNPEWRRNPGTRWAWPIVFSGLIGVGMGMGFYVWWMIESGWSGWSLETGQGGALEATPMVPDLTGGLELWVAVSAVVAVFFAWPTARLVWRLTARQEQWWREARRDRRIAEVGHLRALGFISDAERSTLERRIRSEHLPQ